MKKYVKKWLSSQFDENQKVGIMEYTEICTNCSKNNHVTIALLCHTTFDNKTQTSVVRIWSCEVGAIVGTYDYISEALLQYKDCITELL